ncbi:hypothetical protein PM082_020900 [Marasmius tenuissimus]|nr:hypothetical protein PM082_020900 [Marasmius tenuissimus]
MERVREVATKVPLGGDTRACQGLSITAKGLIRTYSRRERAPNFVNLPTTSSVHRASTSKDRHLARKRLVDCANYLNEVAIR